MRRGVVCAAAAAAILCIGSSCREAPVASSPWQDEFGIAKCTLLTSGSNRYMVLEPGFALDLEGGGSRIAITVLDETKEIAGVLTRVVEEREWKEGKLHEVSRNYFAFCEQTRDIFYFGEDVDFYAEGRIVGHDGSWRAGADGNRPGLYMPGSPKPNFRHYLELAPDVAMDRAEIVALDGICATPAGTFAQCLTRMEDSAIDPDATELKHFAPGIGLVREGRAELVLYGFDSVRRRIRPRLEVMADVEPRSEAAF